MGPYEFLTYGEVRERVQNFASGMASFGLKGKDAVGLYSVNRIEWVLAEYACYFNNQVTVPLYDTLGDEAIEHICGQTEMQVIVASHEKAFNILRLRPKLPSLKYIIIMDEEISDELAQSATKAGVELIKFGSVEKRGAEEPREPCPPSPDDLCTICYTSGTTGLPKGVMLPHKALLADGSSVLALAGVRKSRSPAHGDAVQGQFLFSLDSEVVHLSYLPLAHVYERVVMTTLIAVGASIGFYQGSILKLLDDIAELKPTLFVAVPRLLNRVYDKIIAGANAAGGIKKFLFTYALRSKTSTLKQTGELGHWLWDRVVFAPVRARLGGRVTAILSGSAPLSPEVMDFLRVCFSCEVYEGYGQTETSAGSTLTVRGDWTSGQIGVPLPCNEVKLVDIPDMGYTTQDQPYPRGEICVRGPNCFTGYYKAPELTRDALDADGWVHTGDVGSWDEFGRLRIIDRKKNLFKLAQGEYISPEKIENVICRNKYIAQAFVDGNSLKASLVAILVPDFEVLEGWAIEEGLVYATQEELARMPPVKDLMMRQMQKLKGDLKGFEIPRDVHIEHEAFSVENGLLTSTMKLKRFEAKAHYSTTIKAMYDKMKD